jgi:hypothetical protein
MIALAMHIFLIRYLRLQSFLIGIFAIIRAKISFGCFAEVAKVANKGAMLFSEFLFKFSICQPRPIMSIQ